MLRLYVAATASTSIGLEVAHVALIYAALLVLVIIRWLIQRGGSAERIAALQAEVSEARVQYEAVCVLLQKRTGYDDLDSEPEGDEREHLIVPPKPVVIEEGIKGMRNHARTLRLLCALHLLAAAAIMCTLRSHLPSLSHSNRTQASQRRLWPKR